MDKPYQYTSLNDSHTEIRLLKLVSDSPLSGQLSTASFTSQLQPYTALSYAWKNPLPSSCEHPTTPSYFHIDGHRLEITHNLEDALRCLYKKKRLRLWIDAICIDQSNDEERGNQVGMMRTIYTEAQSVFIYLGLQTDDSDMAMDFLARLATGETREDFLTFSAEQYYESWEALQNLLRRSWWKRAWVIQEFALATRVEFVCGDRSLSETQFRRVEQTLTKHWGHIFPSAIIQKLGLTCRDLDPMLNLSRLRIHLSQGKELGILPILSLTRASLASDPNDSLFAKYGLLGERGPALCAPDYSMSFDNVCWRFAKAYIKQKRDLSILCHVGMVSDRKTALPSWIPDWGASRPAYPLRCSWGGKLTECPKYDAAKGSTPVVEFSADGQILRARGLFIDGVDGVQFDPWCHRTAERKEGFQSKSQLCAYATHEQTFEALWKTVVADTRRLEAPHDPIQAPAEFGLLFARKCMECDQLLEDLQEPRGFIPTQPREGSSNIEKRWHGMRNMRLGDNFLGNIVAETFSAYYSSYEAEDLLSHHPLWQSFEHSLGQAMYHRRLFTTCNGYIGIGSRTLRPGDRICVLLGCVVPLIVRPRGNHYELIGECYIHGMMNGETFNECASSLSWISLC